MLQQKENFNYRLDSKDEVNYNTEMYCEHILSIELKM
jgi:hypothetical protein